MKSLKIVTAPLAAFAIAASASFAFTGPAHAQSIEYDASITQGENLTVGSGTSVTLNAMGTGEGLVFGYSWERTSTLFGRSGDPNILNGVTTNTANLTFTADTLEAGDERVTHLFLVRVTARDPQSETQDRCCVTSRIEVTVNPPPVANAGTDRSVEHGADVRLDGRASDTESGDSYAWRQISPATGPGANLPLSPATGSRPLFTAPALNVGDDPLELEFELTVTNPGNNGASSTDTVTITVTPPPPEPTAVAGDDRTVVTGTTVTLDGSDSSSPSGANAIAYAWTQTAPTSGVGANVSLSATNVAQPTFTAPTVAEGGEAVDLVFELTVTNTANTANGETDTDMVTITVAAAPTIEAGEDRTVTSGTEVTLAGTVTMPTGYDVSHTWTGPSGVVLTGANTATASFTAENLTAGDPPAVHEFTLTAVVTGPMGSGYAETLTDTVTITVNSVEPFAEAGPDRTVRAGEEVTLEGSHSLGAGRAVVWRWTQTDDGPTVALSAQNVAEPTFTAPEVPTGTASLELAFELRVTDTTTGDRSTDAVTITVTSEDELLKPLDEFLQARNKVFLSHQPNLIALMRNPSRGGDANFELTGAGALNGAANYGTEAIWGEITGSHVGGKESDGAYLFLAQGLHYAFSDDLYLGAMIQADRIYHDIQGGGTIRGKGFMAGPYVVAKHPDHPLYASGSALVGETYNDFKFRGREGSFDTTRYAFTLDVEGEFTLDGPMKARMVPYLRNGFVRDDAKSFTDSIGVFVPGLDTSVFQFDAGNRIEIPLDVGHGDFTLNGGLGAVTSRVKSHFSGNETETRGKAEIGFSWAVDNDVSITFGSFYDGLGGADLENLGATFNLEKSF